MENKNKGITLVIATIAAASLLSLGAFAAPAYAGGDDGVKQKAESEADCDQKNKVEDGSANVQDNFQRLCIAASINANDISILPGGPVPVPVP
jgi:hypothetical protein